MTLAEALLGAFLGFFLWLEAASVHAPVEMVAVDFEETTLAIFFRFRTSTITTSRVIPGPNFSRLHFNKLL
jgi:hypothetical protein